METQLTMPDPQQLRAEAEKEPSRRGIEAYSEAIRLLKNDKGFSFREIAAWLQERNLRVDHNVVWRVYMASRHYSRGAGDEQHERTERNRTTDEAMPWA